MTSCNAHKTEAYDENNVRNDADEKKTKQETM